MKVCIKISLNQNAKGLNDIVKQLIDLFLDYAPEDYYYNSRTYKWNKNKLFEKISMSSIIDTEITLTKKNSSDNILIITPFTKEKYKYFSVTCNYDLYIKNKIFLKEIISKFQNTVISIFVFDHVFFIKQNTKYEKEMQMYGFGNELNKFKYIIDVFGDKVIDVDENIGKAATCNGTFLTAAPHVFVSSLFYKFIPQNDFLEYNGFSKVEKFENNSLYLELFENVLDTEKDDNLKKILNFYCHFNFQGLFKQFK